MNFVSRETIKDFFKINDSQSSHVENDLIGYFRIVFVCPVRLIKYSF